MAGNVNKLDTVNFDGTIQSYSTHIEDFEELVRDVNSITNAMIERWKGKGRDAFQKDCAQVQLNLKDISGMMYDLRNALIDAHANYLKTDSALSKSFDS